MSFCMRHSCTSPSVGGRCSRFHISSREIAGRPSRLQHNGTLTAAQTVSWPSVLERVKTVILSLQNSQYYKHIKVTSPRFIYVLLSWKLTYLKTLLFNIEICLLVHLGDANDWCFRGSPYDSDCYCFKRVH